MSNEQKIVRWSRRTAIAGLAVFIVVAWTHSALWHSWWSRLSTGWSQPHHLTLPLQGEEPETSAPDPQRSAKVRPSVLAGSWYPAAPKQLRATIRALLAKAGREITPPIGRIWALIVPHAGYYYSGATAAYSYRLIQGRDITRVILLGPAHHYYRAPFRGISIAPVTHYQTPLGLVTLDLKVIKALLRHSLFRHNALVHQQEHCLEIQLPFLQCVLSKFKLVPLLVGHLEDTDFSTIATQLQPWLDQHTIVIASSDFTHYGPRFNYLPFKENIAARLRQLDMGAVQYIRRLDFTGFRDYCRKTAATICGRAAIAITIQLLQGRKVQAQLWHYTTSGAKTKDYTNSVSYVSLSWCSAPPAMLNSKERLLLLRLARQTIQAKLTGQALPVMDKHQLSRALCQKRACFVTLTRHGCLRGCIGSLQARQPLYQEVMQRALQAAFQDYRFPPLRKSELADLHIEISVLSPPHPIRHISEFRPGEHGIILRKGGHGAVYLPQVAPQQGWDRETTLSYLARKAGLATDAWRQGAHFSIFTVEAFEEEK